MPSYGGYVYILTDENFKRIYIGYTSDLITRISEHIHEKHKGYTQKHNLKFLVFYELHDRIEEAYGRELQLKGWKRSKKDYLIKLVNPYRINLIEDYGDEDTFPEIAELPVDLDTRFIKIPKGELF